jgi:hypothetical protein
MLPAGIAYGQKFAITEPPLTHRSGATRGADPSVNGFSAPVLGYVVDAAGSVRKMPGLAGASWLTAPLDFGLKLSASAVSPGQDYILGLAADGRRAMVLPVAGGQGPARPLAGVDPGADRVMLSPSGATAAFYFSPTASLQIVTGLPDAPAGAVSLDLSSLPGPPTAFAVSDDGSLALASAPTGDGAAVFALSSNAPPRLLLNGGDFAAMAFLRNSPDAVLADRLRNTLYRVRDAGGTAEVVLLASESDGISAPVSVAASSDRSRLFVANSGSATIGSVSAAGGPLALTSCTCSPTTLAPLSGNAVFRLTEVSSHPVWLLDADAPEPRLLLLPQAADRGTAQ